jgi:cellulose biosynthesis protein BcsQ
MKVITIAAPKGGTGKSNTASILATRAAAESPRSRGKGGVAMIDLNEDQATLSQWWALRGRPVNPYLLKEGGALDDDIKILASDGWEYCVIDGPPYDMDLIEMTVVLANVVIIPIKLALSDISAIDAIVDMCKRRRKPFNFVVNEYDSRQSFKNVNEEALALLTGRGPIMRTRISYHPKYRAGQMEGKTGPELDDKLAKEIDKLWTEVKTLAGVKPALNLVGKSNG